MEKSAKAEESVAEEMLSLLHEVRRELRALRKSQLIQSQMLHTLRCELHSRVSGSRDELGALIKASHLEICERLENLDGAMVDQDERLGELESDFDEVFNGRS